MFYRNAKALIAGIVLLFTGAQVSAENSSEPLALQNIMRDMGKNMQVITGAISREDWALVEKTAPLIADHPQPPMFEKMRIFAFVNTDIGQFKSYDGKTHEAARILGITAGAGDGHAIIADFATLQDTCLMCHEQFRKPFQAYFYGND